MRAASCRATRPHPRAVVALLACLAVLVGACAPTGAAPTAARVVAPYGAPTAAWSPPPGTSWQWQLSGTLDLTVDAAVYDVDGFNTDAATVAALHARGRRAVCYLNAGAFEDFRPDAAAFPAAVLGKGLAGWPGERWLDIRRLDALAPVMGARLDLCQSQGFDAVEPDNVDGYANASGFPLTAADQLAYNRWFAGEAHRRGMGVALKNDGAQVPDLVGTFDFAVVEQCFAFDECDAYQPFVTAGKAVFAVEYDLRPDQFCDHANARNFDALKKNLRLDAPRTACRAYPPGAAPAPPPAPCDGRRFPETGYCLAGRFLAYWEAHGGLARNGYPLSDPFAERLEDGRVYTVQYCERVRLEDHPEHVSPDDVLLGQFGRRFHPADPPVDPHAGAAFFAPTGHNVPPDFLAYWSGNGGLAQFGYPLSEEFVETLEDGRAYAVQYFERARFERHPEIADPGARVLLGQFGRRALADHRR